MAKILLVEDDRSLARLLILQLQHDRYLVEAVADGGGALAALRVHEYDLVILDWMLPDMTGIEVCRQYRSVGGRAPILMLTARGEPQDKVFGLDSGADDYMVKPFNPPELSARIRALLRRPSQVASKVLTVKDVELDPSARRAYRAGVELDLTAKEFALLELLMRHPNQSFSVEAIFDRLWTADTTASVETVRTHMKTLRRKLKDNEEHPLIRTKRGLGYKICTE